jgi:hypothetical protein
MSFNELPPTPDNEPNWVQPIDQQPAPADPSNNRARRAFKAGAWMVAGAVAATVITGVAFASSSSPTPSSNGSGGSNPGNQQSSSAPHPSGTAGPGQGKGFGGGPGRGGMPGMHGGFGGGFGGLGMMGRHVLHGEATVQTKDGTKDVVEQSGVQQGAVSGSTFTVKSSDGFSKTWTLPSDVKIFAPGNWSKGAKPNTSSTAKPTTKPTAQSSSGSVKDLVDGANVTVVGENKNGTWTAEYIVVLPKGMSTSSPSSSSNAKTSGQMSGDPADLLTAAFGV